MSISRAEKYKNDYYPDGITKITDPFWHISCIDCGKVFYSVTYTGKCPNCGSIKGNAILAGKSLEQVVFERKNQCLSEFIRDNQTKSK